jgi:general secretion pathway protein G
MVSPKKSRARGFTLIELMIVISIVLILLSISVPMYNQSILRAREAVLRQDLYTMRQAIDQYTLDKLRAPQALEDLVSSGYLREVPLDPFTNRHDTWVVVQEDVILAPDQTQAGIYDVRSGAEQASTDGTAYSSW